MDKHLLAETDHRKTDYQEILFSKAFNVVPGMDYNQASYELRGLDKGISPIFYEVILKEGQSWQSLKDGVYPNLIRYLRYKAMDPGSGKGLIVSLFFGDKFYLIEGSEFIGAFCEMERIDRVTFRALVKRWLSEIKPQEVTE